MEIQFNPSPKQYQAWEYLTDTVTTEIGYGGAAHGGKSYLGCFWVTSMCLAYPDTAYLLGRKELTNLKRTTLLTLFKVFKEFGLTEKDYDYNQQNNIITFANGSQIFLLDLGFKPSDPLYTRLGGLELTSAFIDESNECQQEGIEILKTRLGRRNNEKYGLTNKLLETFNPDKGHVYGRYYKPWKDDSLPKHRAFIQALPTDNPYTPKDYLEQLRRSDKITRERLLMGNFEYDDDPTTLIRFDYIEDLWTNTIDEDDRMFMTVDVARYGGDKTVMAIWKGFHALHFDVNEGIGIDRTVDRIKDLAKEYKIPFSHILIDEDGVGGGVVDMLRGVRGFMANRTPFPNRVTGKPDNFVNLKSQCSYLLADWVNSHKMKITCSDEIKEQIRVEMAWIKRKDPDKDSKLAILSKEDIKLNIGRSPDVCDAIMMRMYFELEKPTPPKMMNDPITVLLNKREKQYNTSSDLNYK